MLPRLPAGPRPGPHTHIPVRIERRIQDRAAEAARSLPLNSDVHHGRVIWDRSRRDDLPDRVRDLQDSLFRTGRRTHRPPPLARFLKRLSVGKTRHGQSRPHRPLRRRTGSSCPSCVLLYRIIRSVGQGPIAADSTVDPEHSGRRSPRRRCRRSYLPVAAAPGTDSRNRPATGRSMPRSASTCHTHPRSRHG